MSSELLEELDGLPGADFVTQGLEDLAAGKITEHSLLVLVGEPRLQRLGIKYPSIRPAVSVPVEHALYDFLSGIYGNGAHSRYNSILRRMNSFAHALERER